MARGNRILLTGASFSSMFFLGVGLAIIGAAARNIGLTASQIGLLQTVQNIGFMSSVTLFGYLADTHHKPRLLLIGTLLLSAAFFFFYMSTSFAVNALIMFAIGISIGSFEGVTDALLIEEHTTRKSFVINVNHFFVTVGSLAITVYLLFLQLNWRLSMTQSAAALLVVALLFALGRGKRHPHRKSSVRERFHAIRSERVVAVLFFAMLCGLGLQIGTTGILTTFLMEFRDFTQVTSKIALIVFIGGLAVGRVVVGFFARDDRLGRVITLLFASSTVLAVTLYFINVRAVIYPAAFGLGFTVSALLPLIIALTGVLFPHMAGSAMGAVKIGIPAGGIAIPFFISILAHYLGTELSLLVFPITGALGLLIMATNLSHIREVQRHRLTSQTSSPAR